MSDPELDPDPYPLVKSMAPRIQIQSGSAPNAMDPQHCVLFSIWLMVSRNKCTVIRVWKILNTLARISTHTVHVSGVGKILQTHSCQFSRQLRRNYPHWVYIGGFPCIFPPENLLYTTEGLELYTASIQVSNSAQFTELTWCIVLIRSMFLKVCIRHFWSKWRLYK